MAEAEMTVALSPLRRAGALERTLGVVLISCCAAFGSAVAHAGARPWRYAIVPAALGMGASWGALASSLWKPPPARNASPWSEAASRRAFTVLVVVLACIAVWAWAGTPGPIRWPSLSVPRWLVLAAVWTGVVALSFHVPTGESLPFRMGGLGVGLACLAFWVSAWGTAAGEASFPAMMFFAASGVIRRSRVIGALEAALFGGVGGLSLLQALDGLARLR